MTAPRIRVLVVDDSALVRRLVATALSLDPSIEVVGLANDGQQAVEMVERLRPDAVTLDIEMPVLDGLGALVEIRRRQPRLPVIMFSTLTEKGARATLDALSLGASDFVTKPSNTTSIGESMASVREQLIPKLVALVGTRRLAAASAPATRPEPAAPPAARPEVLLIGCSTGGPDALSLLLGGLPADLGVPVLVVQHMPPLFTAMLAERLDRASPLRVREASGGEEPLAGEVLLAPGGRHLAVRRVLGGVRTVLDDGPAENFCRPAVDVLFRSAASAYGARATALLMTGMGHDGLAGTRLLAAAGAHVLAQDEATSVVWGMPGAVVAAGLANEVLPLGDLVGRVRTLCGTAQASMSR